MQIQQYKGRTLTFQITNPPNTNCFVYCLSEVDGPIRYVGKTEKGLKRIQQHLSEKKKRGKVSHKANWINKLRDTGLLLEVSILEEVSSEVINEAEVFYISYFKSLGFDLTNKTEGGEGLRGYKHSNETRILMSEVGKGKKHSPLSEKELEKIREIRTKVPDRVIPKRGTRKSCGQLSEEHRARLSISNGGGPIKDQNGVIYSSVADASRKLSLDASSIAKVLKGKWVHTKGFTFSRLKNV